MSASNAPGVLNGTTDASKSLPPLSFIFDEDEAWFTPRMEKVLTEVFQRFDKDGDGVWKESELQTFAMACNQHEFSADDLKQWKEFFAHDEHGNLMLEGFLSFYTVQTPAEPAETWNDLDKLGYDRTLVLRAEPERKIADAS